MRRALVFGGTTEGRELAEYCARNGLPADVSVATDYGAELLPENTNVLRGRLDSESMTRLVGSGYSVVVDATHPYAVEATDNIRRACDATGVRYLRLLRKSSAVSGRIVRDTDEAVALLNETEGAILSALGGKSLSALTKIENFRERLWVRVLPSEEILRQCRELGYDENKTILEKGPFSVERNVAHLRKSRAKILLTKESGAAGGYPEKVEAARICGAELVTLARPAERGCDFGEIINIIEKELKK